MSILLLFHLFTELFRLFLPRLFRFVQVRLDPRHLLFHVFKHSSLVLLHLVFKCCQCFLGLLCLVTILFSKSFDFVFSIPVKPVSNIQSNFVYFYHMTLHLGVIYHHVIKLINHQLTYLANNVLTVITS